MTVALSRTQRIRSEFVRLRNTLIDIKKIREEGGSKIIDILNYMSKKASFPLQVNSEAMCILEESRCNILPESGRYSLEELLNIILHSRGLDYHLDEGTLRIIKPSGEASSSLELYDVGDLIAIAMEDRFDLFTQKGPWENEDTQKNCQVFGVNFEEIISNDQSLYYSESTISQLIEENVYKGYNTPRTMITSSPGKLYISDLPKVHQHIRKFLDELRKLAQTRIVLETTFIVCKNSFFKQAGLEFSPIYNQHKNVHTTTFCATLSEEEKNRLFKMVEDSKDSFLIRHNPLRMHHLESRHIMNASKTHFLAGYDSVANEDVIGRMYDGIVAKVRPQIDPETKNIHMDIDIDISIVHKPVTCIPVSQGEIVFPTQLTQHMSTRATLPCGAGILLAGFANPYEDEGDKSFSPSRKKDQLMLYFKAHLE